MGRRINAIKRNLTHVFNVKNVKHYYQHHCRRRHHHHNVRSKTPSLRTNVTSDGMIENNLLRHTIPADCLIEIFSYLEDDQKTLQSCVLVNKLWCENSVPVLWAQPFNDVTPSSIIDIYMSCLTEAGRTYLIDNGINVSNRRRSQIFDYVSFLKHISMGNLYTVVLKWTDRTHASTMTPKRRYHLSTEPSLVVYQTLCRLFFSRRSSLRSLSLDWGNMEIWKAYPLLLYSAGINTYLAQLKEFKIHYITDWSIFGYLSKYAKNIETLHVIGYSFELPPHPEDEQNLASLITIQENLRNFSLFGYSTHPILTLNSLGSQCNSLVSVEIVYIHFNTNSNSPSSSFEGLALCRNLEELVINNCLFANEEILSPLIYATFPSLRKIHIVESTFGWDAVMVSLIQNNPSNLKEIYYKPLDNQREQNIITPSIIECVSQYCPWIIRLGVPIGTSQICHLAEILTSNVCQLKSLSIFRMDKVSWDNEELWRNLGGLMPTTLRHLNIWIYIGETPMRLFLQNTSAPLETLYVRWWTHYLGYDFQLVDTYLKNKPIEFAGFLRHVI